MDREELERGLAQAGLSEYEVKAYVTLLDRGKAPATELAEQADIPRSRVYDVLRDLEEDDYVETYEQDSLHARAREPTEVFERLRERAQTLERTAEEIQDRWQQAEVGGHRVSFVKRRETVLERAKTAIEQADNRIEISLTVDEFEELAPALARANRNDVFVSVSFNTSPDRPVALPDDDELADVAIEARHRDLPAPFLLLVDHDVACFSPHTSPVDTYGVIVEDRELLYVFRWYFRAALWESWPRVFSARSETLPAEYVDIRDCIRDVTPLLTDDATVRVTVRGRSTDRRRDHEFDGTIVDVIRSGTTVAAEGQPGLTHLAGRAAIVVETDDGVYSVGGTGASLEDVEAYRVTVRDVTFDEEGQ